MISFTDRYNAKRRITFYVVTRTTYVPETSVFCFFPPAVRNRITFWIIWIISIKRVREIRVFEIKIARRF